MFAYSIHGRNRQGVIDYVEFFRRLAALPATRRQTSVGSELVAISYMSEREDGWLLRFLAGEEGLSALIYDPETGAETYSSPAGRGMVASANWMFVDPDSRIAAIERRRPGVGVSVMARALGHISNENPGLPGRATFDLNPVVSESFADAVEEYERIRVASVVLARPNFNWDDNAAQLTDYAGDSNADDVEVAMSARRGESLAKDQGIVADLLSFTKTAVAPIKNLRVTGRKQGETRETQTSLKRHQEKRAFPLPSEPSPPLEREAFHDTASSFVRSVANRDPDDGSN
jgi:hypothetical protein